MGQQLEVAMVSSSTGNATSENVASIDADVASIDADGASIDGDGASIDGDERVSRTLIKPRRGFRAELPGLDIATLIQMTCARRERLVVRVASYGDEGFLYSADGRIVHATLGPLVGEEAVLGMMAWSGGEFAIVDRPFPRHPSIESSTETLLLRAAQRSDKATHLSTTAPAPTNASEPSDATGTSAPPSARRVSIPPPAPRVSIPPPAPRASIPPPAPRASTAVAAARMSTPPAPGRASTAPTAMPPSAYASASAAPAKARGSVVPGARDVTAQGVVKPAHGSIENALRQSYDEEDDDVPTLLPPSPRTDGAHRVTPRSEAPTSDTPRASRVPPPLPLAARKPAGRSGPLPVNDSALIASVRVDARGEVVGTFSGDGSGDLLPQLVAYVARLIALLRADFSLDPFEALHAELSGMRIVLFEDAGEMVGLMMRPGSSVQELRQRLGV